MPSVRYYNNTAPFWDFIANMEEQGSSHPFFGGGNNNNKHSRSNDNDNNEHSDPWEGGWASFPFGPFPHRSRHHGGPPHHHHHGGPPPLPPAGPPGHDQGHPPPPPEHEYDSGEGSSEPKDPPPPFAEEEGHESSHERHHRGPHSGPRGRCGGKARGGPWGGRGRGGPFGHHGGPFGGRGGGARGFGALAEMFQSQLFGQDANKDNASKAQDFTPELDVFDTAEAFIIHVSLPGAQKSDVGITWSAEKSELSIAGVIHRPGDEELLKTLAMDERRVGVFERKVRLGSRANPAAVDGEGITARMEEGILRVEVPKLGLEEGFVEVRKVDVE